MNNDISDLDVAWSQIEGEGLVRVIPTDSFKTGFIVVANIGKQAELLGLYPEITLNSEKVIVTIDDDNSQAHDLARAIDEFLAHEPDEPTDQ